MKFRKYISLFFIGFSILMTSCTLKENTIFVSIKNNRIYAPTGQEIFLKGLNIVNKSKKDNYLPHYTEKNYLEIKEKGYNCIRLGINWAAIEPKPMNYSEDYLQQLDEQIRQIKSQHMYIILDMHQDLYGVKFGGGAPLWATLDEGKPNPKNQKVWSDAYYENEAVQTAFDNFWNNSKIPNSKLGLQNYYASLWKLIAKRYRNETSVIGYDIINEPFIGSKAKDALESIFSSYAQIDTTYTVQSLQQAWNSTKGRETLMAKLSAINTYKKIMEAPESIYQEFEQKKLQPFYQKIADAIRTVDANHILFLEPSVSANNGVLSVLTPTKLLNGKIDKNIVFSPHVYDIVTDTRMAGDADNNRLDFILNQQQRTSIASNFPIMVGEWGAFYTNKNCKNVAEYITNMFEKERIGHCFWDYQPSLWRMNYFSKIQTIYPQLISGSLISIQNTGNSSVITWKQVTQTQTVIYIPDTERIESIDSDPDIETEIQQYPKSSAGLLVIKPIPNKKNLTVKVTISLR